MGQPPSVLQSKQNLSVTTTVIKPVTRVLHFLPRPGPTARGMAWWRHLPPYGQGVARRVDLAHSTVSISSSCGAPLWLRPRSMGEACLASAGDKFMAMMSGSVAWQSTQIFVHPLSSFYVAATNVFVVQKLMARAWLCLATWSGTCSSPILFLIFLFLFWDIFYVEIYFVYCQAKF